MTETTDPRDRARLERMNKPAIIDFALVHGYDVGDASTKAELVDAIMSAPLPDAEEQEAMDDATERAVEQVNEPATPQLAGVLSDAGVDLDRVRRVDVLEHSLAVAYVDGRGTIVGRHVPVDYEQRVAITEELIA